jgi:hypothetical protein
MLTSGYNPAALVAHPQIQILNGHQFSLGATWIQLQVTVPTIELLVQIEYVLPMAASLGAFGSDSIAVSTFKINIKAGILQATVPSLEWIPEIKYQDQVLYLLNLPQGLVELRVLNQQQTATNFWAYFKTGLQIPGSTLIATPATLVESLYLAAVSKDLGVGVSAVSAVVSLVLKYQSLPDEINRLTQVTSENRLQLKIEIGGNLTCALYLLKFLALWRAAPQAQQLDTNLESDCLDAIKVLARSAQKALDLRTGLVFATATNNVYANPSSIATATALIVWHELAVSYEATEFLLPGIYAWPKWALREYNPVLESAPSFSFATALLDFYIDVQSATYTLTTNLLDCTTVRQEYLPLTAFLPNIEFTDGQSLPRILQIPRLAKTSLAAAASQAQTASALFFQAQIQMLPYGYLWPTVESLLLRSSIWRALFLATSEALAYSWLIQLFFKKQDPWLTILFPIPKITPVEYWQELASSFYKSTRVGSQAAEALAYLSGLVPLTTTLVDYAYLQLPPTLSLINYPELATLDALAPTSYQPPDCAEVYALDTVTADRFPTEAAFYLESLSNYSTLDRFADQDHQPLNLTDRTNWLAVYGEGKPASIVGNLHERLPVYTKVLVYFHTWGMTQAADLNYIFNPLLDSLPVPALPLVGVYLTAPLPIISVVVDP